jgi:capsular polysaccharide biosynthesis protein
MKWLERIPEEHREPVAVLLVSISVFIWGAILTLFLAGDMAETYTSEAKLLVKESPKEALSFGADQTMQRASGRGSEYLVVQLGLLNSSDVRERVAKRLLEDSAIPDIAPDSQDARANGTVLASGPDSALYSLMGRLSSRFKAENERNSPLISLKTTWRSKTGAQQLLQYYIDAFADSRREFYSMDATVKATERAVESAEQKLMSARAQLSDFLMPHGVISLERDLINAQTDFDNQRRGNDNTRIDLASKRKQLDWWKDSLSTLPVIIKEPSSTRTDQRRQGLLSGLDKASSDLAATPYLPGTLTHSRLKAAVNRLTFELANMPLEPEQLSVARLNPAITDANSAIRELEGSIAALDMQITLGDQRLGSLEIEVNRLTRLNEEALPLLSIVQLAEHSATDRQKELLEVSAANDALLIETESAQRLVQTPSLPSSPDQFGILTSNTKVGFFLSALAALLAGFVTKVRLPRRT